MDLVDWGMRRDKQRVRGGWVRDRVGSGVLHWGWGWLVLV